METYFNNLTDEDGGRKQLVQDIGKLIEEAEGLIKNTAEDLSEKSKSQLLEKQLLPRLKKNVRKQYLCSKKKKKRLLKKKKN